MMGIIYMIAGLVIGAAVAAIVALQWKKTAAAEVKRLNDLVESKDSEIARQVSEMGKQAEEYEQMREKLHKADNDMAALQTRLQMTEGNLAALNKSIEEARDALSAAENDKTQLTGRCEALRKEVELLRKQEEETERRTKELMKSMEEKLTITTGNLLKTRSEELEKNNSKAMGNIVEPLKEKLHELQTLVMTSRDKSEQNTATVAQQIKDLMARTLEIGNEATRLTNALTQHSQFQGSMGEQILGNILQSAGLRPGRDYEEQPYIKTSTGDAIVNEDTGRKMRPDVILHFPDKKDAVIDSKVSLKAYEEYVNAETEAEKLSLLKAHIGSMRKHVDELSAKKYNEYIRKPYTTIDFVIMFVPFEGAFQTAMLNDPQLWTDALRKNVCIAGELNLTVILRMIKMAWTQHDQTLNQQEVYKQADEIVKRMGLLCSRMKDVEKTIKKLSEQFESCNKSLYGTQALVIPARKIVALGAKDDSRIPQLYELPPTADDDEEEALTEQ